MTMISILFQCASYLLGLIDLSFRLLTALLGNARPKLFRDGWGDLETVYQAVDKHLEELKEKKTNDNKEASQLLSNNQIEWGDVVEESKITIQQGSFTSPFATLLPKESRRCTFRLVRPRNQPPSSSEVYVILLPATGEMGKSTRLQLARTLAAQQGFSSVIVTAPFYGSRKPPSQSLFFLNTVSDLLLQSVSITHESALLALYFQQSSPSARVCLSGFSWGAAMSACAAVASLLRGADGARLACAPYVGSASPVVLVDGILEQNIDWQALLQTSPLDQQSSNSSPSQVVVRQALLQEFSKTQLATLAEPLLQKNDNKNRKQRIGVVHVVCMEHDHFIRRRHAEDFVEQVKMLTESSVRASWLPGGHVFAMMIRPFVQRRMVVEAVKALEKLD